jgi:hypothetical protein
MRAIAIAIPRGIRPDQRAIAPHADPFLIHLSRILRRDPDPDGFVARFALMGQDPPVLTDWPSENEAVTSGNVPLPI